MAPPGPVHGALVLPGQRIAPSPRAAAEARSGFIVGPVYDAVFFILSPLFALFLGAGVSFSPALTQPVDAVLQRNTTYGGSLADLFMGSLIMAHIVVVFFRSHGNPSIFRTHPLRFTLVPALLLGSMMVSTWALVCISVLATWWDVYHSGMQTFGLGRIYDARAGNDAKVGRRLDMILNQVIYAGPILAGVTLMDHVEDFDEFGAVGSTFFTAIPAQVESVASWITWAVLLVGLPFVAFYVWFYARQRARGYRVSMQKVVLLSLTAVVSILAWGFNSFGTAFLIMNFFHAIQYFAIVWATEERSMQRLFRMDGVPMGRALTLGLFVGLGFMYGLWAEAIPSSEAFLPLLLTVSILHFWYDGFIWSVRRKQV